MKKTLLWIIIAGLAAGLIGAWIAALLGLDPVSSTTGSAIGGAAGGWIAKKQSDVRLAKENES